MPDWISLEEARTLAFRSGATDESLNEILMGGFRERRIAITAVLEHAPVDRVREHWWARAAELEVMQTWRTPRHVEQFLTRAVRVCVAPDNRLRALILWGDGAPPLEADTCILAAVHLHRPALAFELEAAGFTGESGTTSGDDLIRFELPTGVQPDDHARSQQRGAYRGPLEEWMAEKLLATLRRMIPAAIANDFRQYCEDERPEFLPLLPKRLRSMEPLIKRIVARRVVAAKAPSSRNKSPNSQ